ncbi:hypothetical protein ACQZV8_00045 [Magnetococcales bacterium HHB-1]
MEKIKGTRRWQTIVGLLAVIGLLAGCGHQNKIAPYQGKAVSSPQRASQGLQPPIWRKGEWWEYSDGYTLKVDQNHPKKGETTFKRYYVDQHADESNPSDAVISNGWVRKKAFFRAASKSERGGKITHRRVVYRSEDPMSLFPLKTGTRLRFIREFWTNKTFRVHETSWYVKAQDDIEVPAGQFKQCWVLVWKSESAQSEWTGYEKMWYCPGVKNYVRMEYKYGANPPGSRVLMRYHAP